MKRKYFELDWFDGLMMERVTCDQMETMEERVREEALVKASRRWVARKWSYPSC